MWNSMFKNFPSNRKFTSSWSLKWWLRRFLRAQILSPITPNYCISMSTTIRQKWWGMVQSKWSYPFPYLGWRGGLPLPQPPLCGKPFLCIMVFIELFFKLFTRISTMDLSTKILNPILNSCLLRNETTYCYNSELCVFQQNFNICWRSSH